MWRIEATVNIKLNPDTVDLKDNYIRDLDLFPQMMIFGGVNFFMSVLVLYILIYYNTSSLKLYANDNKSFWINMNYQLKKMSTKWCLIVLRFNIWKNIYKKLN